jgi:hypothetical protein
MTFAMVFAFIGGSPAGAAGLFCMAVIAAALQEHRYCSANSTGPPAELGARPLFVPQSSEDRVVFFRYAAEATSIH